MGTRARQHTQTVAILAAGTLVLVAFIASIQNVTSATVPTFDESYMRPFESSGVLLLASPALTIWGISVYYRCSDKVIRQNLFFATVLLLLWMVDALAICAIKSVGVIAFCWYLYQIPILFIPLLLFFNALHLNHHMRWGWLRYIRIACTVISFTLCAVALTNDAHQMLYVFDFSSPNWQNSALCGPVYWISLGWGIVLFASALFITLGAAQIRLRLVLVLISFIFFLALLYTLLYSLHMFGLERSNYALNYTTLIVAVIELCLDFGVFPAYVGYTSLFAELPLDLKLLVPEQEAVFRTVFKSSQAKLTSPEEKAKLLTLPPDHRALYTFKIPGNPNTSYKAYRIHGGIALLTEDISVLNAEKRKLEERQAELTRQIEMLEHDRSVRRQLYRQARQEELYEAVENSLKDATQSIRALLDDMPTADNEAGVQARRHQFALIKLLTAYCKRKGSLVLAKEGNADFDKDRLSLVVNEIVTDMRTAGAEGAAIVEINHPIPALAMNTLYDCLYEFVSTAFRFEDLMIMIFLREQGIDAVTLRVSFETNSMQDLATTSEYARLLARLEGYGIEYELDGDVGQMRLVATVPCYEVATS